MVCSKLRNISVVNYVGVQIDGAGGSAGTCVGGVSRSEVGGEGDRQRRHVSDEYTSV